ncbi:F0F1 ATP synthase subunit epsilon [Mangrovicella endophytica]|uniref:F0F1 ATP synthase subunit epsilon n=1 Tax=Mangrovicella endophytica TaxID=2066697 RepID=UPI000C9E5056|nr:F0F1 ATP synthase subunit epsilon [Mangrovicella endophytica]
MADSFSFDLVSPERLLLSEPATAVLVPGTEGYFTVMARHAPLMTTVKPGVVVATMANGSERRIFVQGGFADINENGLTLLAERATRVEDLDMAEIDSQIRNAEEDLADAKTAEARSRAELTLSQLRDVRSALGA